MSLPDTEYDLRQLARMWQAIGGYEDGTINLRDLVHTLEFLLNAIEGIDATWVSTFQTTWGDLETIKALHAVAQEEGRAPESTDDEGISDAVKRLKKLIGDRMAASLAV